MIWDLLDYGAKNRMKLGKYPIMGLGSVGEVRGSHYVPCLHGNVSGRCLLDLSWYAGEWGDHCRLLGVRKEVSQTLAP